MLVRKLLVAYIMKIGSLNRLTSIIFWRMAPLLEFILQQLDSELSSDSGMPARVDSLQSNMDRRYLSGFFLNHKVGEVPLPNKASPVLWQVKERSTVKNVFPPHDLEVDLSAVSLLLLFELRHAPELDVRPVGVVQHGRVRHRHAGGVLVLVIHPHLLTERLHRGHIAAIEQQLLQGTR